MMPPTPSGQSVPPVGGVVVVPPKAVNLAIKEQVARALDGVDKADTMAIVSVRTGAGFNLAIAHKFNEDWHVAAYIGKSGWNQPTEYGATVTYSR